MPYKDKEIRRLYQAEYNRKHAEKKLAQSTEWREANRIEWDAYQVKYRSENKEERKAAARARYAANRDRYLSKNRLWVSKNKEIVKELNRKWHYLNRDRILSLNKDRYIKNRSHILEQVKEYSIKNPHIGLKCRTKRRMRLRNRSIGNDHLIDGFVKSVRRNSQACCYYCKIVFNGEDAHIDHVIPLSRGGLHEIGNLCSSCVRCNMTKHSKLISEWKRDGQQILPL